ncbi:MAG TPA: YfiR family protein [Usitatibacter sp.]|nr:YfiR family protein [Usitatibacter sp.]
MGILSRSLMRAGLAVAAFCAIAAFAQQASEAVVKAAFLYKFAGYIEWPNPSSEGPFVIATLNAEDVAAELDKLLPGRSVNGRPAIVRRVREGESLRGVHILFIGRGEANTRAAVRAAQQQGVVPVTETERGLEMGAAINFVVIEDRVGFEVSLDSADRSGHRISSRMLAVARRVVPKS